jgi:uncharacterized protein YggE
MVRFVSRVITVVVACLTMSSAFGQMVGTRGVGAGMGGFGGMGLMPLTSMVAKSIITVEGTAEIRVRPTEIRVVLAVTSEAETANQCRANVEATIERLKAAWSKIGIKPEKIVVDFIAVVPRYGWGIEKRGNTEIAIEKRIACRMQTNVHLATSEDQAQAAVSNAFEQGVTDIIGFDYWSKDLDEIKIKAREQAVKTARSKADMLLGAFFHDRPPAINVQEQTTVFYPESLYHTVGASAEENLRQAEKDGMPRIEAYRPKLTYYHGLTSDADVQPRELPMKPEISVVSTVRLYFKSPASEEVKPPKSKPAAKTGPASGREMGGFMSVPSSSATS